MELYESRYHVTKGTDVAISKDPEGWRWRVLAVSNDGHGNSWNFATLHGKVLEGYAQPPDSLEAAENAAKVAVRAWMDHKAMEGGNR